MLDSEMQIAVILPGCGCFQQSCNSMKSFWKTQTCITFRWCMLLEVFQMPHQREKMWSSLLKNLLYDYSEFINSSQGMIKQLNSLSFNYIY